MSLTAEAPRLATHVRHRPEQTLLYQLVERYYPEFARLMAAQGSPLPAHVAREFEDYLTCGRLEHGFLRVRCETCHHEKLVAFSCKRRGFCPSCGDAIDPKGIISAGRYGIWPKHLRDADGKGVSDV